MAEPGGIEVLRYRDTSHLDPISSLSNTDQIPVYDVSQNTTRAATIAQVLALVSGVDGGATSTFNIITDLQFDDPDYQFKSRSITIENGVITDVGDESDWTDIPAAP